MENGRSRRTACLPSRVTATSATSQLTSHGRGGKGVTTGSAGVRAIADREPCRWGRGRGNPHRPWDSDLGELISGNWPCGCPRGRAAASVGPWRRLELNGPWAGRLGFPPRGREAHAPWSLSPAGTRELQSVPGAGARLTVPSETWAPRPRRDPRAEALPTRGCVSPVCPRGREGAADAA